MKRSQIALSLAEAVQALNAITNNDLQKLALIDCARMLYALPQSLELASIRGRLAYRLRRQLKVLWVEQGNVYEVFAVLIALWRYHSVCVTGEHLAAILRRLIMAERVVGGPYDFKNADMVAVNAKVAFFMRLVAKPLPNVDAFLARAVDGGRFGDAYLGRIGLLYLLAQAGIASKLVPYVKSCWTHESWQTPLGIVTALMVLKDRVPRSQTQRAIAVLCSQQRNGFWKDGAFAASGTHNAKFVTTAIVVGALECQMPRNKTRTSRLHRRQELVVRVACQEFAGYSNPLRSSAIDIVAKVGAADKNFEITQLSVIFADALKTPDILTDQQHTRLGLASFFGWVAYTIYDDFLDSEGQPAKLPVANIAMRTSINYFRSALPGNTAFVRYVAKIFSAMDEANAWEVGHCRFIVCGEKVIIGELPKYGRRVCLASRSFAHTLAPMAVLWQPPMSKSINRRHIKVAFSHYLIARQLSDDLHDWVDDMKAGQASYVVTAILRDMRVKPGEHILSDLLPAMRKSFRRTVLLKVCRHILEHVAVSRQEFQKSELLYAESSFYVLLEGLELTARYTLDMHAKSLAFYEASKNQQ